ncbi:cytochrome p450 [Trifolium pratense]|uniref:Cytochrome p450 n=1 Tax=Trifolium pratense TaxID=57577 RepID=A0A2K3P1H7_TRIPR|nr:cytochrome p450 [Trifolium pratense]
MHEYSWEPTNCAESARTTRSHLTVCLSWTKQKPDHLKCNVDFTLFQKHNKIGFGAIVRDLKAVFPMAQTAWSMSMMEVHEGEAASLLSALNWMQDWEADRIIFEPDCKTVVDVIHRNRVCVSEWTFCLDLTKTFDVQTRSISYASSIREMVITSIQSKKTLALTGPPQVNGGIVPLGLVGTNPPSWIVQRRSCWPSTFSLIIRTDRFISTNSLITPRQLLSVVTTVIIVSSLINDHILT